MRLEEGKENELSQLRATEVVLPHFPHAQSLDTACVYLAASTKRGKKARHDKTPSLAWRNAFFKWGAPPAHARLTGALPTACSPAAGLRP